MTAKKSYLAWEAHIIQLGTILFWLLFWLFNFIDKLLHDTSFWVGRNRLEQFQDYFASIGILDPIVSVVMLVLVSLAELLAFFLLAVSLWHFVRKRHVLAAKAFFWATTVGLCIFGFFTIGDQVFGDRFELLEHTIYWIALIVSWGAYTYYPRLK
jgi:hypothetical protein